MTTNGATNGATKRATLGVGLGSGALGVTAGIVIGILLSRGGEHDSPLPLRTFDWILDHGINGVLLVVCFMLGWQLMREQKGRAEDAASRLALEHEYREKIEKLLREQVTITQQTGTTLDHNTYVLQSLLSASGDEPRPEPGPKGDTPA